jgi:hypothetical protein
MIKYPLSLSILLTLILSACVPIPLVGPESIVPTLTSVPIGHDIADLPRNPLSPGQSVEVDAYFSGAGAPVLPSPPPLPGQIVCPAAWNTALTDRPFPAVLSLLNGTSSNMLPDDAPWLTAVTSETLRPGVYSWPQLPYHARLRGHLGAPALAQCQHADRVFIVEGVIKVYSENPPEQVTYALKLPDDYAAWPRYHDAALGFSLPHPRDWRVERLDDVTWSLRAPQWATYPVTVRVHSGETHYDQYDSASMPPLMQGFSSFGLFNQDMALGSDADSQHLAGYHIDREAGRGERSVSVLFSGGGRTYELALTYPLGFDAPQPLLTAYSAIVVGFRLDVPPGPTPTPPVKQSLGAGPFLTKAEILTRIRERNGRETELLDAKLTSEAEARQLAEACDTFMGHPDGVWVLIVRGVFEEMTRTMRLFLDAMSGDQLCGEEIILNATPYPTLPFGTTATPVPTPTPAIHQP